MRRRLPDHRVRDVWAATDSPTGYSGLLSPRTVRGGSEVSIGQGKGGGNTFRPSERKGAEIQQKRGAFAETAKPTCDYCRTVRITVFVGR